MSHRSLALGIAVALAMLAAPAALAAQDLTRRQALDADGEVEVVNVAGRVQVTGWDRNEVELTARLDRDSDQLEFTGDARHLTVRVKSGKGWHGPDDAILTLHVPRGAALDVQAVSADVRIEAVAGRQRLETVSGEVHSEAFDQDVTVRSVSGDVRVGSKGGKAQASVNTVSGKVSLQGFSGTVGVEAVSGDLELDLGTVARGRLKTVSGDVQARLGLAPAGQVDVETMSGDVSFHLKPPVNADFDLESFSGTLESCFGADALRRSQQGPGSELRLRQGDGSARVRVDTLSGDVTLCDK